MNKYVTNLTLPNGTNLLIKDSECRTNLSNEINRATRKETELKNDIDAETTRATRKETELKNAIDAETTRATRKETELQNLIDTINNAQHPIGSIYMSMNSTSPSSLFGGTWEQIKDRFLLASGDTYTAGNTGGEATHKLTVGEMPAHHHSIGRGWGNDTGTQRYVSSEHSLRYSGWSDNDLMTNDTGGSQPHNNMPPYLTVYMWKRIA